MESSIESWRLYKITFLKWSGSANYCTTIIVLKNREILVGKENFLALIFQLFMRT